MSKNYFGTMAAMRKGDFHLRKDARQMFGNFVVLRGIDNQLSPRERRRKSAGVIETPVYDEPKMWRLELLFSAPAQGGPAADILTPWVPVSHTDNVVRVTIRRAIDRDKAVATETFDLTASIFTEINSLPVRVLVGHQIGVNVELISPTGSGALLGVQASLVEVTNGFRDPWGNARILSFPQIAGSAIFLEPNMNRRQFFVCNDGASPLYVAFDEAATVSGPASDFTFILPNRGDVYESPRDCWQGYVSGAWAAVGGADDGAQVTEGT